MSPCELPMPDDPELEVLHQRAIYEHYYANALHTVKRYPHLAARVMADWLVSNHMLEELKGSIR